MYRLPLGLGDETAKAGQAAASLGAPSEIAATVYPRQPLTHCPVQTG